MKKLVLLVVTAFCMSNLIAQNATDALLYSQDNIQGTARYRAWLPLHGKHKLNAKNAGGLV